MAVFRINSRIHGAIAFTVRDGGGYLYVSFPGRAMPRQCGPAGSFSGNMLTCKPETLEREARAWWRGYLAFRRDMGV